MSFKLTPKQSKEPMNMTWGRIRAIAGRSPYGKLKIVDLGKLEALIEKFNRDLANAKIEEGYFK